MVLGGAADPMIGREFAGYHIERFLGRGGMGVVYRAESLALGRKVALKLLSPDLAGDDRYRARFLSESRLAASLDHPNVIPIYEAGESDGRLFIAMEYVEGTDLRALLAKGPLAPSEYIETLSAVAAALEPGLEDLVLLDPEPQPRPRSEARYDVARLSQVLADVGVFGARDVKHCYSRQ